MSTKVNPAKCIHIYPCLPSGWSYYVDLTIDHTKVDTENQTDFPVYINEHDMPAGFWTHALATGADVVVCLPASGRKLRRELVSIDTTGHTMELHTRVPILSHDIDTVLRLCYGNANGTEVNDALTWNSNFKLVSHMNDDPDTSHIKDSTSNGNNGTKKAANEPVEAAGQVGKAQNFDGENDYVEIADAPSIKFPTQDFTVMAYFKPTAITGWAVLAKDTVYNGVGWTMYVWNTGQVGGIVDDNAYTPREIKTTGTISAGEQTLLVLARDSNTLRAYLNAVPDTTFNLSGWGDIDDTDSLKIGTTWGAHWANGLIDEVRISNTARSAGWIKTTYNNLNDVANFYSVGAEQSL